MGFLDKFFDKKSKKEIEVPELKEEKQKESVKTKEKKSYIIIIQMGEDKKNKIKYEQVAKNVNKIYTKEEVITGEKLNIAFKNKSTLQEIKWKKKDVMTIGDYKVTGKLRVHNTKKFMGNIFKEGKLVANFRKSKEGYVELINVEDEKLLNTINEEIGKDKEVEKEFENLLKDKYNESKLFFDIELEEKEKEEQMIEKRREELQGLEELYDYRFYDYNEKTARLNPMLSAAFKDSLKPDSRYEKGDVSVEVGKVTIKANYENQQTEIGLEHNQDKKGLEEKYEIFIHPSEDLSLTRNISEYGFDGKILYDNKEIGKFRIGKDAYSTVADIEASEYSEHVLDGNSLLSCMESTFKKLPNYKKNLVKEYEKEMKKGEIIKETDYSNDHNNYSSERKAALKEARIDLSQDQPCG